ncbi:hypothetical protein [Paludisphaera soli]|uniref:hypothetical protein n=1 Tax=Paludisphaera soli TaxID=2712865 RepID=UPI0013EA96BA|nr:hypothetical protein [Paludisphaera soli]
MARTTPDGDFDGPPKAPGADEGEAGARLALLLALLAAFTLLTFLAVSSGSPSDVRQRPRMLTTLATATGPFTGAIARGGQSCCLEFSLRLAAWLAPILAAGILASLAIPGNDPGARALRLGCWTLGWFLWLAGGPVSFLHALN